MEFEHVEISVSIAHHVHPFPTGIEGDTLWIVSDKGRCLFQYDWAADTVLQRLDLTISTGDKPKRVRKPEGIAFDPDRNRLYVVSDRDGDLYVFRLHDDG